MLNGSNKPTITAGRMSAAKPAIAFSGFDQPFHSVNARLAGEVSPLALGQASTDWAEHLWLSPDKQAELARDAATKEHRPIQPLHPTVAMYDSGIGVERREPAGKTRRLRPCAPTARRIRPLITDLMDCGRSNRRATC
jgi:Poly-beta-hydroxybutyrate polymerase N terminal